MTLAIYVPPKEYNDTIVSKALPISGTSTSTASVDDFPVAVLGEAQQSTTCGSSLPEELRAFLAAGADLAALDKIVIDEKMTLMAEIAGLNAEVMMAKSEVQSLKNKAEVADGVASSQKDTIAKIKADHCLAEQSLVKFKDQMKTVKNDNEQMHSSVMTTLSFLDMLSDDGMANKVIPIKRALQVTKNSPIDSLIGVVGNLRVKLYISNAEMKGLKEKHDAKLAAMSAKHQADLDALAKAHSAQLAEQEASHLLALNDQEARLLAELEICNKTCEQLEDQAIRTQGKQNRQLGAMAKVVTRVSIFGRLKRWFKKVTKRKDARPADLVSNIADSGSEVPDTEYDNFGLSLDDENAPSKDVIIRKGYIGHKGMVIRGAVYVCSQLSEDGTVKGGFSVTI